MSALSVPKPKPADPTRKVRVSHDRSHLIRGVNRPPGTRILTPVNEEVTKRKKKEESEKRGCWIGLFSGTKDF